VEVGDVGNPQHPEFHPRVMNEPARRDR
jgi:hypothetical protein